MARAARAKRISKPALKRNAARKNKPAPKVSKPRAAKAELKYIPWNSVQLEDLNPLLQRQFVVGQEIMLARVVLKKGCIVPEHSHHNEQLTYILEGALKFWIDGKVIVVNAGEVLTIPPHMPHKAEALEDTVDLDVFNPPRADWINKTDNYLRGRK
jgi:quercetin dioxygenase-like cupin family protein